MRGRHPKPVEMRQNRTKKSGRAELGLVSLDGPIPIIPNPDERTWHPLTLQAWQHAWRSPMASQWLETDTDALGRLALLWDQFYTKPMTQILAEIRLQESRFGLSPLDRSRLQWEIRRAEEPTRKGPVTKRPGSDPRALLMAVK
jgi:hypothetical protein